MASIVAKKRSKPTESRHSIIIVEDHPLMRDALRETIDSEPDMTVCAEADGVASGLERIKQAQPDLAIIDVTLVDGTGLDLIRQLREENNQTPVLVLSLHDESILAERAIRAGAMGYVNKRASPAAIKDSIRQVLAGNVHVNKEVLKRILQSGSHRFDGGHGETPESTLSDRELEVYRMLGQGFTVSEMAQNMQLSQRTIETYRYRIRQKLNIATSNELIAHAASWMAREY